MKTKLKMATVLGVICAMTAGGAIIIDDGTGWVHNDIGGGASFGSLGGEPTTSHTLTAGDPGTTPYQDLVYTTSGSGNQMFGGGTDISAYEYVSMTFGTTTYTPDELMFYIYDGSATWYYDLPTSSGTRYTSLGSGSWYGGVGAPDFTSVTQLGLSVIYTDTTGDNQVYSITSYQLMNTEDLPASYLASIPEPGSFIVLSTALMSLGFTYARRKKEQKAA